MFKRRFSLFAVVSIASLVLAAGFPMAPPADAQTFSVVGILPSTTGPITNVSSQQITQGRNGDVYAVSNFQGGLLSATTSGTFAQVAFIGGGDDGVTLGADGNLYTNIYFDRIGCGEVIKVTPTGTYTSLDTVCSPNGNGLTSAPIQAPNGLLYGTTTELPSGGSGTIYSVTSSGTLKLVYTFSSATGSHPIGPLAVGSDGNFYGGTREGGTNNDGVLYRVTPTGTYTVLHNFNGTDGRDVETGLFEGHDGNLYGVTQSGGTDNLGVVFQITNTGVYTVLYNFLIPYSTPNSSLVQATDGKLYGLLGQGNSSQPGWIYSVTTTGTFTILHEFCQESGCTDGIAPWTPLIQHTNGKLYGFTDHGGDESVCQGNGCGVFYTLDVGLGPFASLVTTSGREGAKIGILGQGFSKTSVVKFGGTQATSVIASGSTFLMATVPAAALTGSVTVTTGKTTLTSAQAFKVSPTVTLFTPPNGPVGTSVTITGTGLTQATKVTFDKTVATFVVNSDTQITATVPTGAKTGKIAVTTKGGSATSTTSFTVN